MEKFLAKRNSCSLKSRSFGQMCRRSIKSTVSLWRGVLVGCVRPHPTRVTNGGLILSSSPNPSLCAPVAPGLMAWSYSLFWTHSRTISTTATIAMTTVAICLAMSSHMETLLLSYGSHLPPRKAVFTNNTGVRHYVVIGSVKSTISVISICGPRAKSYRQTGRLF